MKKIENTALQMIAEASRCPDYGPDMVKSLMKKLDMNEKGFALLMNVAPSTVRLWTSGLHSPAAQQNASCRFMKPVRRLLARLLEGSYRQMGGIDE